MLPMSSEPTGSASSLRQAFNSCRATRSSSRRVAINRGRTKMSRSSRLEPVPDGRSRYAASSGGVKPRPGGPPFRGDPLNEAGFLPGTRRRPRRVSPLRPSGPICSHSRPRPRPPTTEKEKVPTTNPTTTARKKGSETEPTRTRRRNPRRQLPGPRRMADRRRRGQRALAPFLSDEHVRKPYAPECLQ